MQQEIVAEIRELVDAAALQRVPEEGLALERGAVAPWEHWRGKREGGGGGTGAVGGWGGGEDVGAGTPVGGGSGIEGLSLGECGKDGAGCFARRPVARSAVAPGGAVRPETRRRTSGLVACSQRQRAGAWIERYKVVEAGEDELGVAQMGPAPTAQRWPHEWIAFAQLAALKLPERVLTRPLIEGQETVAPEVGELHERELGTCRAVRLPEQLRHQSGVVGRRRVAEGGDREEEGHGHRSFGGCPLSTLVGDGLLYEIVCYASRWFC